MENLFPIGAISKIHGFKGFVKAEIYVSDFEIKTGMTLFLEINKKPVPFFVEECKGSGDGYFIKFDDINNPEDAEKLLSLTILAESENDFEEYENYHNIEGYKIIDQNKQFAGEVLDLISRPGQDLLEIEFEGKTYFLPCVSQIILKINHKQKTIFTEIPEGIISINN